MSKKIKFFAMFFALLVVRAKSDVVIAQTFDSDLNTSLVWKISKEKYNMLTEINWNDDKLELSLHSSVKKAILYASKLNPDNKLVLDRVSIVQPIRVEERKNIFFYNITIDVYENDGISLLRTIQLVMFLDGTIIEPVKTP